MHGGVSGTLWTVSGTRIDQGCYRSSGTTYRYLADIQLGKACPVCVHKALQPILSNANIFAVDLYEAGLGETVEALFLKLVAGPGAIRAVLKETFTA